MSTLATWDDEYARLARAVTQLRASGSTALTGPSRSHQISSIKSGLDRLSGDLKKLEGGGGWRSGDRGAPPAEVGRRRALIEGLRGQVMTDGGAGGGGNGAAPDLLSTPNSDAPAGAPSSGGSGGGAAGAPTPAGAAGQQRLTATDALSAQDSMLADLSTGVSRLKSQTHAIHDETRLHNRLLDEMDDDVDLARAGMEEGALRARRVKEEKNLWRLYMIIAGLSVLLFLLILMGLS